MKIAILNFCICLFLLSIATGCQEDKLYDVSKNLSKQEQDTVLTNIMIYIYKLPRGVRKENKFNQEYRPLYSSQLDKFKFVYYFVDEKKTHYFYLIRPARNAHGHKRGVAGKFTLNEDLSLSDFEEIFNTPMLPEDTIISRGEHLWKDLMHFRNIDRYYLNKDYIEFPNENCIYNKETNEWVY